MIMKYFILTVTFLLKVLTVISQEEKRIVILHTNDLHSRLEGFSPESAYSPLSKGDDNTFGGFSRIAAIIEEEKSKENNVLVVDAGDFLMGTLFHTAEAETGFQLRLMKEMGYDAVALGNHEFDFGPDYISKVINISSESGGLPLMLLGNAVLNLEDSRDDGIEKLFKDGLLLRYVSIVKGDIKVGIFSLLGENAIEVAPYSAPLKFEKQKSFAKKAVKYLKDNGCDIVICLSHSGLTYDEADGWEGEDYELAKNVKGIDAIISGHTHSRLSKPLVVGAVPVVQAGEYGREIGRMELVLKSGKWELGDYRLISVDDKTTGRKDIQEMIGLQKDYISEKTLTPFGIGYSDPVFEVEEVVECIKNGDPAAGSLGQLVADAIYSYVNRHSPEGADVSMVSAGVIRDNFMPGKQSIADIFRVMPLGRGNDNVPGYPFSRLYVTGRELKNIIEVLLVAQKGNTDYHCYFSGLKVEYNPEKGLLKKISSIYLDKGEGRLEPVDLSKNTKRLYSVTANSYMLEFIGIIKKKTFGIVNVTPKNKEGAKITDMKTAVLDIDSKKEGIQEGKEWLSLYEFVRLMKDTDGDSTGNLEKKYYSPGKVFEAVNR
jgi:5'-nucleotidase